jgi:aspartokinase/homoserine dehydrogenase 1
MRVLKFGGSSVATSCSMKKIAGILKRPADSNQTIVVVSALGGITDGLLQCGLYASSGNDRYKLLVQEMEQRHLQTVKELLPIQDQSSLLSFVMKQFNEVLDVCNGIFLLAEFSLRTRDKLTGYGELISSYILSAYLQGEGLENTWVDARKLIITDDQYTQASVQFPQTAEAVKKGLLLNQPALVIVPGFIASSVSGYTTTLGRGGSDYTAAILGSVLNAGVVEIWTDVSGLMTADPRQVSNARPIPRLSYQEAMELSHFGAKVIYPPTVQPLLRANIPVWIKNTFAPDDPGTLIEASEESGENLIRGITCIQQIALLSLEGSGMIGIPGFSMRLFDTLALHQINVILITQASSEHSICVGVDVHSAEEARNVINKTFSHEIEKEKVRPVLVETGLSIIALVGDNMKSHPGISGRMFSSMGRNGINVRAIAQGSSERNISAVIAEGDAKKTLNVLHEEFFETTRKQVNLFIAGTGNVGGKLLAQLSKQQSYLQNTLGLQVRVIGLANSRTMTFRDEGVTLSQWKESLSGGEKMDIHQFVHSMLSKNLRNSIFVDMTASEEVSLVYDRILRKSVSVIACNKTAASSLYVHYKMLKDLARDYGSSFLFETNVGASLPIIGTLNNLTSSGDTIQKIEAVLSGTLNYVFNHYDAQVKFADIVRQAQEEGYTEPDPRLDLSGVDVMRKILILVRESGSDFEMDSIRNEGFLPPSCMEGTVDDFYREMEKQEDHFKALYQTAAASGNKLKFVARYAQGEASVGLQQVSQEHDFYHLYGKDNIVLFYTNRYPEQPMVIKGAGAGADVTASGVFADIIRAARI